MSVVFLKCTLEKGLCCFQQEYYSKSVQVIVDTIIIVHEVTIVLKIVAVLAGVVSKGQHCTILHT